MKDLGNTYRSHLVRLIRIEQKRVVFVEISTHVVNFKGIERDFSESGRISCILVEKSVQHFYLHCLHFNNKIHLLFFCVRMSRSKASEETDKQTRIAIVSEDKCKPKRCRQECKKSCPVVRMGKLCIEVSPNSKIASLSEELCIGCGICVKVIFLVSSNIVDLRQI